MECTGRPCCKNLRYNPRTRSHRSTDIRHFNGGNQRTRELTYSECSHFGFQAGQELSWLKVFIYFQLLQTWTDSSMKQSKTCSFYIKPVCPSPKYEYRASGPKLHSETFRIANRGVNHSIVTFSTRRRWWEEGEDEVEIKMNKIRFLRFRFRYPKTVEAGLRECLRILKYFYCKILEK
jgi:hypothetical protein